MVKLARGKAIGKILNMRRNQRNLINISYQNELLSEQIADVTFTQDIKALKVNSAGVVLNADYANPSHTRWLED